MKRIAQTLAFIFAKAYRRELIRQVQYLQAENKILRSKLPKRIQITPAERTQLLRFGKPLGTAIRGLISIVHPRTFYRWKAAEGKDSNRPSNGGKGGRPRQTQYLVDLVLRMARETDWCITRITAEVKQLHVGNIGRTTVRNILSEHGVEPGPSRSGTPWDDFVSRHAETLWACDFLSVRTWSAKRRLDLYLLVFIHTGSRRVYVSPATVNPNAAWTEQQARNFLMYVEEAGFDCSIVLHDRDAKFTAKFDAVLDEFGASPKKLPPCSPNLNAFAERFVQTIKHECLNHFIVFGTRHLDHLVSEFVDYYHRHRSHQALENRPPIPPPDPPPEHSGDLAITCDARLGGVLKHYRRAA